MPLSGLSWISPSSVAEAAAGARLSALPTPEWPTRPDSLPAGEIRPACSGAQDSRHRLGRLLRHAPVRTLGPQDRLVILSDLHLGDGSSRDEFVPNAELVEEALRGHYLPRGYGLVLNGDIEELQKFTLRPILCRWRNLYRLWERFQRETFLVKLWGNHDAELPLRAGAPLAGTLAEALTLDWSGHRLLVFHGHQAGRVAPHFAPVTGWILRWLARPLRIPNPGAAHDSRRRYLTERRVYAFARRERIIAVIGHTHRPLFESLSRVDSLKFELERLCRAYAGASADLRGELTVRIRRCQEELLRATSRDRRRNTRSSLYGENPLVPCLFNSGCAVGKRGFTALEIEDGEIALVHWLDRRRARKFTIRETSPADSLPGTPFQRVELKRDSLEYIFTRVHLLA
jgi:UDP-2,3-diacylglucosamine pyrophosphatase LpxH